VQSRPSYSCLSTSQHLKRSLQHVLAQLSTLDTSKEGIKGQEAGRIVAASQSLPESDYEPSGQDKQHKKSRSKHYPITDSSGMYLNARVRLGVIWLSLRCLCLMLEGWQVGRYTPSLLATVTISHYTSYSSTIRSPKFRNPALISPTHIPSTQPALLAAKPLPSPSPTHCHQLLQYTQTLPSALRLSYLNIACIKTCAPIAQSSGFVYSTGL